VANGEVDAATVNLFLGATTLVEMGLRDQITPQETPVSEQGLHIVISKRHWRGTTFLYRVNTGLSALRDSGRYQEIVSRHLEGFWSLLK
jgi:polar amino acid transport system substrate-binding protein